MAAALLRFAVSGDAPQAPTAAFAATLATHAQAQGLGGLLHEHVHANQAWPAEVRTRLRAWHQAALLRGTRQLDLLERARQALAAQGQRSLPLKGAALAERLYRSVAERPMADVDLLVLDAPDAALELLLAAGFALLERADHAAALLDPLTGEVLELHHAPASCPRLHPLDVAGLWERSRPASGQVQRVPGAEDLLVLLAQHCAFQHGLVLTLVQWLDIARLLAVEPPHVERLLTIASAARADRALAATLHVAARLVGAVLPGTLALHVRATLAGYLGTWLDRRLATPMAFISPARPELARTRWMLSSGQRRVLLADTLRWNASAGSAPGPWRRLRALARRALFITRRHTPRRGVGTTPPG